MNGGKINESYVKNYCTLDDNGFSTCPPVNTKVPEGKVLVLGDNRQNSWDSRFWPGTSFVPEEEIIGRATWRFWPFDRIGLLNN